MGGGRRVCRPPTVLDFSPRVTAGTEAQPPRPFLKWAGGKRQLLAVLRRFYPPAFGTYFEPFAGSAAVFFDLVGHGRLDGHRAVLSDTNVDVIGCYAALRRDPEALIAELERLAAGHARGGREHYYEVRDGRFNPQRIAWMHDAGHPARAASAYPATLAAMVIYLNRTGFNGLFRLNSRGGFNVPAGRYARPRVVDAGALRAAARALSAPGIEIAYRSFEGVLDEAGPGDFLYFDPPYVPLSATSSFTAYTAGGFGPERQADLQRVVVALSRRGCHVVVSNSATPLVGRLYRRDPGARAAGLRIARVQARRAINAKAAARGPITEYVITNVGAGGRGSP